MFKNYVIRAQATSSSTAVASSGHGLPDAQHLRAEAEARGSDWLRAELDGSMTSSSLRSFGAGLGVSQRDPTSGQQRTKGQLLAVLVESLCPPSSAEAWFSKALVSCQQCSREQRIARKNVFVNSVSLNVRSWSPCSLCVCKNYVVRAQATSSSTAAASSGDGLPDAEHLRAEAVARGEEWLRSELESSMPRGQLRSFAAGLDVPQRDPTTGQQLAKGQLLDALVAALRPSAISEAWCRFWKYTAELWGCLNCV